MDDRPVWRHLLARADEFLTAHPDLVASGKACRGLGSGGRWMAAVLGRLRNEDVRGNSSAHYGRAGWRKYAPCLLVAAIVAAVGVARLGWLVIVPAAVTFYAMEAQTVFLFPLLADHGRRGQRALRALNHRAGGTLTIMTVVLPLAAKMTLGGLADGRFRRSWLQGCVAVVIWYEDLLRTRDGPGPIFEFSALQALTVRRVTLVAGNQRPLRLVYASDLHIGARAARPMFPDLVRLVARERPDLVLLGGDLVDTQRGLPSARWDLAELARLAPVAAVPGNHDVGVGLARVRDVVIEAGGHWLDQEPLRFGSIDIDARPGQS
ncbi:MAG: metallophosphoesterase, partial [Planctomycetes bacterium]|nr:metallophosphoesterase [Planctomycetota bacterium]